MIASNTGRGGSQPVGLCGTFRMTSLVFGRSAAAIRSGSSDQPYCDSGAGSSGTPVTAQMPAATASSDW
jgi:hypothetical protein